MDENISGLKIAFTTTNGTQAIEKSKGAKKILIGSFLNLSAVSKYLLMSDDNILIVCAGWKGKVNLEDSLFAGALVDTLRKHIEPDCDAPIIAQELYLRAKDDMLNFLSTSSHVKRLNRLNIHKDIEFCLTQDKYGVIPVLNRGELTLL
jgi:2-phosphosulfolactate phosphatase